MDTFAELVAAGQQSIRTLKSVSVPQEEGEEPSITYIDRSDPGNVKSYSIGIIGDEKHEYVGIGDAVYSRVDGGAWEKMDIGGLGGLGERFTDADFLKELIKSAELVDKANREFAVTQEIPGGLGAGEMEGRWFFDDQFRMVRQETSAGDVQSVMEYSEFDKPVEIPSVG